LYKAIVELSDRFSNRALLMADRHSLVTSPRDRRTFLIRKQTRLACGHSGPDIDMYLMAEQWHQ
jgi:hypothetical protein